VPLTAVHVPAFLGTGTLWLLANAIGCLALARLALRR
jgi:hypothetical protein